MRSAAAARRAESQQPCIVKIGFEQIAFWLRVGRTVQLERARSSWEQQSCAAASFASRRCRSACKPPLHKHVQSAVAAAHGPPDAVQRLRAVLERACTAEQQAAELAALRGAWELASVLEFLEVFHAQLGLPRRCSAADLEAALVLSPGGPGVLADVHLARAQDRPPCHVFMSCLLTGERQRMTIPRVTWHSRSIFMPTEGRHPVGPWRPAWPWPKRPASVSCRRLERPLRSSRTGGPGPACERAARVRAQGLLRGISTRSELTEHNWATRLGDRLRVFWQANGAPGRPPFAPARGQEALEYARLPTMQRRAPQPWLATLGRGYGGTP